MIVIVDYEIGNLGAIANMLNRLGARCEISAVPRAIEQADKLILPGNGAFDSCMTGLRATGLVPLLEEKVVRQHTPLLGICVGAQMLGHGSEEGNQAGLGWLDLVVKRFPPDLQLRVPHMGWCHVRRTANPSALFETLSDEARYYFVHSYYLAPADAGNVLLTAEYGIEFAAAVGQGNIAGVQFHPEKSHRFGKQLFRQFIELAV